MHVSELGEDRMKDLAVELAERGYPGGTRGLAREAREWIAPLAAAGAAGDLTEAEVSALTDGQALFVVARPLDGSLDAFIANLGI